VSPITAAFAVAYDDDARAPLGQQERMSSADAASRARDDRDAPLEPVFVHPHRLPSAP
jgi:hypothetical protein